MSENVVAFLQTWLCHCRQHSVATAKLKKSASKRKPTPKHLGALTTWHHSHSAQLDTAQHTLSAKLAGTTAVHRLCLRPQVTLQVPKTDSSGSGSSASSVASASSSASSCNLPMWVLKATCSRTHSQMGRVLSLFQTPDHDGGSLSDGQQHSNPSNISVSIGPVLQCTTTTCAPKLPQHVACCAFI
jgi:hypothetical protein